MYRNLTSDYSFSYEFSIDLDENFTFTGTANVDYDICAADRSVGEPGGPCDFRITEINGVVTNVDTGNEILVTLTEKDTLFAKIEAEILDSASYAAVDDYNENR